MTREEVEREWSVPISSAAVIAWMGQAKESTWVCRLCQVVTGDGDQPERLCMACHGIFNQGVGVGRLIESRSTTDAPTPPLRLVEVIVCDQCLDDVGEECHEPGCIFWMHPPPGGGATLRSRMEGVAKINGVVVPLKTEPGAFAQGDRSDG